MPSSISRNPKAATCEDVDEDTQSVKPGSRTSANVSKKRSQSSDLNRKSPADKQSQHGSDSGYSSKAGTNESMASSRKHANVLTVNTNVMDRPSQPYSYTPAKPKPAVGFSPRVETTSARTAGQEKRFCHAKGDCMTCDKYGYHIELPQPHAYPATTKSPKVTHHAQTTTDRPQARRTSSNARERPRSLYITPIQSQMYATPVVVDSPYPVSYHPGPPTPVTPQLYHQSTPYSYAIAPPMSAPVCCECTGFCNVDHNQPATPQYLEHPINNYPQQYEQRYLQPAQRRPSNELERTVSYAARPRSATSKSSTAHADKLAMPPPPPPKPQTRRSSTDTSHAIGRRQSVHYEDEDRPSVASKRASRDMSSLGVPPSSWKGSGYGDVAERPKNRKSASYSDASADHAAMSFRESLPRRVTDPIDEKAMKAEAYQNKVSRGGAAELTTDMLKKLDKQRTLASETGTTRSKDSVRGKRSGTVVSNSGSTNITLDGGIRIEIPQDMTDKELNLQIGRLTVSMNRDKEQKRIERAPSNASRESRRNPSGASAVDESDPKRPESRRSSHHEKTKSGSISSKRSSRAQSISRPEK